jgi:hypothetical protein
MYNTDARASERTQPQMTQVEVRFPHPSSAHTNAQSINACVYLLFIYYTYIYIYTSIDTYVRRDAIVIRVYICIYGTHIGIVYALVIIYHRCVLYYDIYCIQYVKVRFLRPPVSYHPYRTAVRDTIGIRARKG